MEEIETDINSEIRYITLELMKLSIKKNMSFKKITKDYIKNAFYLQEKIFSMRIKQSKPKRKINDKKSAKKR